MWAGLRTRKPREGIETLVHQCATVDVARVSELENPEKGLKRSGYSLVTLVGLVSELENPEKGLKPLWKCLCGCFNIVSELENPEKGLKLIRVENPVGLYDTSQN